MEGHMLHEVLRVRTGGTPGAWAANADTYGAWQKLAGVARNALLVAINGELDADMKVEVWEAQDANGTGAQELTGITTGATFTNGTHEGYVGLIEVLDTDLSDGFTHIAALPTPGAADSFAAAWVFGNLYELPASNANDSTDKVAFAVDSV